MSAGERFWRTIAIVALVLCAVLTGDRLVRSYYLSATEPRIVTPRAELKGSELAVSQVFQQVAPSVVSISAIRAGRTLDMEGGGQTATGAGSGFVWDRAGHIVTNDHVVEGASRITVVLDDGRAIPARVVGAAAWADLAVLRLQATPDDLRPIDVGSSADLVVGQNVLAIGNPFGLSRTLTTGIISALNRRLPTASGRVVTGVVQTDAAINPGNSGGPLVDSSGRLIGVNTAIIAPSGTFAGVGFAIPVDTVNRIVPALIRNGRAPLPGIGIAALPEEMAARTGLKGVIVHSVRPGSSAQRAGIIGIEGLQIGDVIVAAGGKPVANVVELSVALEAVGIGRTARLSVLRDGRTREVDVEVQDIN
jgi:2-alkenal reductase